MEGKQHRSELCTRHINAGASVEYCDYPESVSIWGNTVFRDRPRVPSVTGLLIKCLGHRQCCKKTSEDKFSVDSLVIPIKFRN